LPVAPRERHRAAPGPTQVGQLLITIDCIGPQTAACIMAEVGDPARFASLSALASYVGVIPRLRESRGNARKLELLPRCRSAMRGCGAHYMPTLSAVRVNPWLRAHYRRLRAAGKPAKVALPRSIFNSATEQSLHASLAASMRANIGCRHARQDVTRRELCIGQYPMMRQRAM
jgi:transposase